MKKTYQIPALKTYQIPALNKNNVFNKCQLLVGTTIPVDPGEEGSQSQAESKDDPFATADSKQQPPGYNPWNHQPGDNRSVWADE